MCYRRLGEGATDAWGTEEGLTVELTFEVALEVLVGTCSVLFGSKFSTIYFFDL